MIEKDFILVYLEYILFISDKKEGYNFSEDNDIPKKL